MKQYYISKADGSQEGPYPENMIQACIAQGLYPPGTLVWCDGMVEWQPIEEIIILDKFYTAQETVPLLDDSYLDEIFPSPDEEENQMSKSENTKEPPLNESIPAPEFNKHDRKRKGIALVAGLTSALGLLGGYIWWTNYNSPESIWNRAQNSA